VFFTFAQLLADACIYVNVVRSDNVLNNAYVLMQ